MCNKHCCKNRPTHFFTQFQYEYSTSAFRINAAKAKDMAFITKVKANDVCFVDAKAKAMDTSSSTFQVLLPTLRFINQYTVLSKVCR